MVGSYAVAGQTEIAGLAYAHELDAKTAALLRALSSVGSWKERLDLHPPSLGSGRLPGSESAYRRQPKNNDSLSCGTTGV